MEYYGIGAGLVTELAPGNPNGFYPCRREDHAGDDTFRCRAPLGDITEAVLGLRDPPDKLSLTLLSMLGS
jgi:hypothetical protein